MSDVLHVHIPGAGPDQRDLPVQPAVSVAPLPDLDGGVLRVLYLASTPMRAVPGSPVRAVGTPRFTLEAISVFLANAADWIVHDIRMGDHSILGGTCYDVGGKCNDNEGHGSVLKIRGERFSDETHAYAGFAHTIDPRFARTLGHAFAGEPIQVVATHVGSNRQGEALHVAIVGISRTTDEPVQVRDLDLRHVLHA